MRRGGPSSVAHQPWHTSSADQISDTTASVRGLRDRSMFGGVGIYAGDLFFALLAEDRLYMKVDDSNRADFTAAGMEPFRPIPGP